MAAAEASSSSEIDGDICDSDEEDSHGGFDLDFTAEKLSNDDRCAICRLILKDPMLTRCGHHMCEGCFNQLSVNQQPKFSCPICRKDLIISSDIFPDNALKRRLLNLEVRCKNHKRGCEWVGELRALDLHLEEPCRYVRTQCPLGCGDRLLRKSVEHHLCNCENRIVQCDHCSEELQVRLLERHTTVCFRFPVSCPHDCGAVVPREEMNDHTDRKGTCPAVVLACEFVEVGCVFEGNRTELADHIRNEVYCHLNLAFSNFKMQKRKEQEMEDQLDETNVELADIREELDRMSHNLAESRKFVYLWKIDNWSTQLQKRKLKSESFYTGRPGYHLYLSMTPPAGATHASLFLHFLEGDYDSLLHWPLPHSFTLSVLDQKVDGNDISHKVLQPRRSADHGPGSSRGHREFFDLQRLRAGSYTKNDTLFVKLVIHF